MSAAVVSLFQAAVVPSNAYNSTLPGLSGGWGGGTRNYIKTCVPRVTRCFCSKLQIEPKELMSQKDRSGSQS